MVTPGPRCVPWMPIPLLPPPIFINSTVFVRLLVSSLAYLGITFRRSSPYFCGQWHCSQVSRAGRRLWTGVGDGRGISVERDRDHLAHAGKLALHEPPGARADVALHAVHPRVRRILIGGEFRLHDGVAGLAAEGNPVHVIDGAVSKLAGDRQVQQCGGAEEVSQLAQFEIAPGRGAGSRADKCPRGPRACA